MTGAKENIRRVENELNRVIRGKEDTVRRLLIAFIAGGHVLFNDVPGVGKTTLAKSLASLVGCNFRRIQFTPDLLPADILGTSVYNPRDGEFRFRQGPVFTNIMLADEINRASPRTQSALLECMCEHQISSDGVCRKLEPPFMVIATENPIEFQGTFPLPEAQLDRFAMRLTLGYPDEAEELQLMADRRNSDPGNSLTPVISVEEVLELQHAVNSVTIEASVGGYLLDIVRATRKDSRLTLGASPRAALVFSAVVRAAALLNDRDFVLPDDVRSLAGDVLAHRLLLDSASRYAGVNAQAVIADIVAKIKMPR